MARLFKVDKELQLVLQYARGERHRILGGYRAVGFDPETQPVIIRNLADAGILDPVGHLEKIAAVTRARSSLNAGLPVPPQRRRNPEEFICTSTAAAGCWAART
jgi:hypothetical protein